MKTSPLQFEMIVTFMEQHGDLAKPCDNARGRLLAMQHWEQLTSLLNSAGAGPIQMKSIEKWKKVWSDLKNNTKRKATRLSKALSTTNGGPGTNIKLTDVENRVLGIIGEPILSSEVPEAGCSYDLITTVTTSPATRRSTATPILPPASEDSSQHPPERTLIKLEIPASNSPNGEGDTEPWNHPGTSGYESPPSTRTQMSPQGPMRRNHRSATRRSLSEADGAPNFHNSEFQWRKFKMEKHYAEVERERERNRIRELELKTQREWISLGQRFLDILGDFVDKFKQ